MASLETDQAKLGSAGDNALFWGGHKTKGYCTNYLKKYQYYNIKHLTSAGKCGKMLTFTVEGARVGDSVFAPFTNKKNGNTSSSRHSCFSE